MSIFSGTKKHFPKGCVELNLMAATLGRPVTFTRDSDRTYFGSDGFLKIAPPNVWPVEFDPITKKPIGRGMWESRTNLFLYSDELSQSYWQKANVSVTPNAVISPDGTQNADIATSTPNLGSYINRYTDMAPSTTFTRSVFAKHISGTGILVFEFRIGDQYKAASFNLINGTVNGGGFGSSRMDAIGNGWYRCVTTFTTTASGVNASQANYIGAYGTTPTQTQVALYGFQMEQGAFATPYIPTTTATVTRSADSALILNTDIGYSNDAGSFYVEFIGGLESSQGGYGRVIGVNGTRTPLARNGGSNIASWDGTTNPVMGLAQDPAYNWTNAAMSYVKGVSRSITANGNTPVTGALTHMDTTSIGIGMTTSATNHLNGYIKKILYWTTVLPDSELTRITKK